MIYNGSNSFDGVHIWHSNISFDNRGKFNKVIPGDVTQLIQPFDLRDCFVTESYAGVVRGMHLQIGAFASSRIIHILEGEIVDVLIDLRFDSKNYCEISSFKLKANEMNTIFIPKNLAHGFESITKAKILYLSDMIYNPEFDTGYNPLSIGYRWAALNPIISERDRSLPNFVALK